MRAGRVDAGLAERQPELDVGDRLQRRQHIGDEAADGLPADIGVPALQPGQPAIRPLPARQRFARRPRQIGGDGEPERATAAAQCRIGLGLRPGAVFAEDQALQRRQPLHGHAGLTQALDVRRLGGTHLRGERAGDGVAPLRPMRHPVVAQLLADRPVMDDLDGGPGIGGLAEALRELSDAAFQPAPTGAGGSPGLFLPRGRGGERGVAWDGEIAREPDRGVRPQGCDRIRRLRR